MKVTATMLAAFVFLAAAPVQAQTTGVVRSGSQPSQRGPAEYFTGSVRIDPLFDVQEPARAAGASVTFEPGARTAWHTHPLGQTLIVTAGVGRVQIGNGRVEEIRPGDVVRIPPDTRHWHGATPTNGMTHIAIHESLNGEVVEWLEHVTDEQYGVALSTVKVRITLQNTSLVATLADNATASDFIAMLPLTLTMRDYNQVEKVSELPGKLSIEGAPAGTDPRPGDIAYYAPLGNLVLYYGDLGYTSGVVNLGRVEGDVTVLRDREPRRVTIEVVRD